MSPTLLSALFVAIVIPVAKSHEPTCEPWASWQPWSQCQWSLWQQGRDDVFAALGIDFGQHKFAQLPSQASSLPPPCGYCSWRVRARKRPMQHGCRFVDLQVLPCTEHTGVCDFPFDNNVFSTDMANAMKCATLDLARLFLRQCSSQVLGEQAEWMAEVNNVLWDAVPRINCVEKHDKCLCCCGKFKPSNEASTCAMAPMAEEQCDEWGEFNDWSDKCMWFTPPDDMVTGIQQHCAIDTSSIDDTIISTLIKVPKGVEVPDRCGYCSFRMKCRKRSILSQTGERACFPLDVEKRACGPRDCAQCGAPCAMPAVLGSCQYADMMLNVAPEHVHRIDSMPHSMGHGLVKLLSSLPFGKCVEKNGACKCCCHPYAPSDDGTRCELIDVCVWPNAMAPESALGLPPRDEF